MKIEISASQRKVQGTGASRRLRRSGRVPGIVYGGVQGAVNIDLDHKELYRNLTNEKFHASILTLKLEGGAEQVLLRAFNMHPFKAQVLKEEGATKVVAYCTHAVLSGAAVERIAGSDLDELVVTDTIPLRDDARACKKIRQLSVAGLLAETILRIFNEDSVSSLFIE